MNEANGWISVKERLPEVVALPYRWYPVVILGEEVPAIWDGRGWIGFVNGMEVQPTHWMPLPTPPQPPDPFEEWYDAREQDSDMGSHERSIAGYSVYRESARAIWDAAIKSKEKP